MSASFHDKRACTCMRNYEESDAGALTAQQIILARSLSLSLVSVLHVDEGGSTESSVLLFEMTDYGSIDRSIDDDTLYTTRRAPTYLRTYVHVLRTHRVLSRDCVRVNTAFFAEDRLSLLGLLAKRPQVISRREESRTKIEEQKN